jgi:hypothetical protein
MEVVAPAPPIYPLPLGAWHVNVKELPVAVGVTVCVPLVGSLPLQPPLAVQPAAFVDDHVSTTACPAVMVVGWTEIVTLGVSVIVVAPPV